MKKLTKFLCVGLLALASTAFADATSAKPLRVGPVQNYGALGTDGGKIVSLVNGKEVMLRGVSLFWSDALGIQYYNSESISWAVKNLGIDVFRFAMGIQYYNSQGNASEPMDASYSYVGAPESYLSKLDQMVQVAIENDVYIIVDWHSHRAENEQALAVDFFNKIAQKYANIPNVIFEIYNEPVNTAWNTIVSYANTVSAGIRKYSKNLILVGTPSWSQLGSYGGVTAINVAYVFHFYAGTHKVGSFGSRITAAKNAGNAVFISEWGTTKADGDGEPDASATQDWFQFMETNHLSNCNWSFRNYTSTIGNKSEKSAMFDGSEILNTQEALANAKYTTSGTLVKNYLTSHTSSWADSLLAGKTAGSCHFDSKTVKQTAGSVTLPAGCTYTSSNESAVTVSGGTATILNAGYAILTGNDGSQSIITVEAEPEQNSGIVSFLCRYGGNCSQGHSVKNYTGTNPLETILTVSTTTTQKGTLSFKALNPEIVKVKTGTCTITQCYSAQNKTVTFAEFTGVYGDGKIVITAPAVTGYRALNDTITVSYKKGLYKLSSYFKNWTLALGALSREKVLPDVVNQTVPVTYTYNGQPSTPYLTKVGTAIQAGTENAIVLINASAPGDDNYEPLDQTITVVVGDSTLAVNKTEFDNAPILAKVAPFRTQIQENGLLLQVPQSGFVSWAIYTPAGKVIASQKQNLSAGSHLISLENLPTGSYMMRVKQGSNQSNFHWNKQ